MRFFFILLLLFSVFLPGCQKQTERLSLDQPWEVYRAQDGAVMLGYYIQPKISPGYTGWHWLVVEPELGRQLLEPLASDRAEQEDAIVALEYEGWSSKARLMPELTQPGRQDPTPPALGYGPWSEVEFVWYEEQGAFRLIDPSGAAVLPLARVSPGFAVLEVREARNRLMLGVLKVAAIAGMVTGIVLLDGTVMFSTYGFSYGH